MKNEICITTYVSGKEYQEFIPCFIYSVLKSYPDYNIIIFCGESLHDNVKESLSYLYQFGQFEVIENFLPFIPTSLTLRVSSMSKRWLLYSDLFLKYEYIYIGDIDIFIVKETPGLLEQHLIHCDTIDLNYSNVLRRSDKKRITGLHFVKRKLYFDKMLPVIQRYLELMKNNQLTYNGSCEFMLYDMITESGLGLCPQAESKGCVNPREGSFRPDHGIHLAVFRDLIVKKRKVISENFQEKMEILKNMIDDPVFRKIEKNFESKMIKRIFKRVHKYSIN